MQAQQSPERAKAASEHAIHGEPSTNMPVSIRQGIFIDFELLNRNGETVTPKDFQGRYLLLTFGFTQCAHICPMIAANLARALRVVGAENVRAAFISVDTERDSPLLTDEYARGFHDEFTGLSGNYEHISRAARNFGVTFSISKTQRSYTVQHTTSIFLLSPEGKLIDIFAMNASVESIAGAIDR